MAGQNLVVVGRMGRVYGVRGWMHLQSYTEPAENLLAYEQWQIRLSQGDWVALEKTACRPHKKGFVAKFLGIDNPEDAQRWVGGEIGVELDVSEDGSADGEYFWRDLIGCQVRNVAGDTLGSVVQMIETGSHDVMQVRREDNSEILIPYSDVHVIDVVLSEKLIRVDWLLEWSTGS